MDSRKDRIRDMSSTIHANTKSETSWFRVRPSPHPKVVSAAAPYKTPKAKRRARKAQRKARKITRRHK